jgi:soluble cytochrome b562
MNITPRHLGLLLALLLPAALPAADLPKPDHEESALDDSMSSMNSAFRKLRRQVADPQQNPASLALVAKLRAACEEATLGLPTKIARLPAKEQAAAKAAYVEKMQELITTVDKLATALKADKNPEAAALIKELTRLEEEGHKQFRTKKKDD